VVRLLELAFWFNFLGDVGFMIPLNPNYCLLVRTSVLFIMPFFFFFFKKKKKKEKERKIKYINNASLTTID
jgi:hypothetical protein